MKNKGFSSVLLLIILAVIAVGVRIFYINNMMSGASVGGGIYSAVNEGIYLNFCYQVVSVMLTYITVRNLSEKYFGFVAGLIAAVFPEYITTISEVSMINMEIFLGVAVCAVAVSMGRCLYEKPSDIEGKETGAFGQKERDLLAKTDVLTKPEMTPIQDSSMREIVVDDVDGKVNYIENPLPVPKRREHKEMDYAFEPSDDDDYDLTDMTGKDFYDIE